MQLREVGWPAWTEAFNTARYQLAREQTIAALQKHTTADPLQIVEIGCGIGFWTQVLTQLYPNAMYIGIDISEKAVQQLQQRYELAPNINFLHANICDPLPSQLFASAQLVICMEVLLHIKPQHDWQQAMHNIFAIAQPQATVLISDPFTQQTTQISAAHINNQLRSWPTYQAAFEQCSATVLQVQARSFLLDNNIDFSSKSAAWCWSVFFKLWHKLLSIQNEKLGALLGSIAYRFDKWYTSRRTTGHSCRLMVLRKKKLKAQIF